MQYRKFGRLNWNISEVGYGMWGMAGWSGGDLKETEMALDKAVELGCNFFDTAWAYGAGKSENILADLIRRHPEKRLYAATKIPPKNHQWPPIKDSKIEEVFPFDHIVQFTEKSLQNLKVDTIDLMQFHVWEDSWSSTDDWKKAIEKLKKEGKVRSFGISVNRWEPVNCLKALETQLIDVVQVIYNIFDQSPEDELFPYCEKEKIAIIARVPFDEGSLTGALDINSKWDEGDFRNVYFGKENLINTLERVERLKSLVPAEMSLAQLALRFILNHPTVSTVIPGMRKIRNVENNMKMGALVNSELSSQTLSQLKANRWDRVPTSWSC